MPARDQSGLETRAGRRPRRIAPVHWFGSVVAAIQLTALTAPSGYSAEGMAHPDEFLPPPEAMLPSRASFRLVSSIFDGAPPFSPAAAATRSKEGVYRESPFFRGGRAFQSPWYKGQGLAWHDPEQGGGSRFSDQSPFASLFHALEKGKKSPQPGFRGMRQDHGNRMSRRQDRVGDDRQKEVRSRFPAPLYLSAALTVSAAAVARLSKDRADDAYETYLKSAGRQRQQSHFEEAERYDRIAGAAFAVMEAGLVWSVYLLFF